MWDGRETTNGFAVQALHATQTHAQGVPDPTKFLNQIAPPIVNFELGVFTAQQVERQAGRLNSNQATGGPVAISQQVPNFFLGINDPFGKNPKGTAFNPNIFDLYVAFDNSRDPFRQSLARGEKLFNTTKINITDVAGINGAGDTLEGTPVPGFCGTCHDTPDVGNHSVSAPLNIGIANAGAKSPLLSTYPDCPFSNSSAWRGH